MLANRPHQLGAFLDEIGRRRRHDLEWRRAPGLVDNVALAADGFDAFAVAVAALEGAMDDRTLFHTAVVISQSAGNVVTKVENKEALEAFGFSPNEHQPLIGQQLIDEVIGGRARDHVLEIEYLEPARLCGFRLTRPGLRRRGVARQPRILLADVDASARGTVEEAAEAIAPVGRDFAVAKNLGALTLIVSRHPIRNAALAPIMFAEQFVQS
jgi:hypothetical protein